MYRSILEHLVGVGEGAAAPCPTGYFSPSPPPLYGIRPVEKFLNTTPPITWLNGGFQNDAEYGVIDEIDGFCIKCVNLMIFATFKQKTNISAQKCISAIPAPRNQ